MQYASVQAGRVVELFDEFIEVEFLNTNGAPEIRNVRISERFHPDFVAALVRVPAGLTVEPGDGYDGATFGPPAVPAVVVPTTEQALAERAARLAVATREIDPLQDLVDLGASTDEDELKLIDWKQYRAAVGKVQTQPGFPGAVVWPEMPEL